MKYFNIKRYKFSTVTRGLRNLADDILDFLKFINPKKTYKSLEDKIYNLTRKLKYLDIRKYNVIKYNTLNSIKKIKIQSNKFLFYHLPISIIFFIFLYVLIPTFYNYDKSAIEKTICSSSKVKCTIKGKISYNLFPTPRLKIKDLKIDLTSGNLNLLTANDTSLKLSIKNLLAKEKHKVKKIIISDFESNINLKKLKNYNSIFDKKISLIPIVFIKGKIVLHDNKNYIATITKANLIVKLLKNYSEVNLEGKFLNDNVNINFSNEINDNRPTTKIELKMKESSFYSKVSFLNLKKNIENGRFLIKKDNNKISGIFDYKDNEITIIKSNIRNKFIDGKLAGNLILLPYLVFNLDLNLNSINFTKVYNYFLSLDKKEQKELFKINKKINGKLNFATEKVYSKHNLIKSFESRIKFYNGNTKIEQFLINLGKLGAADLLGKIDNNEDSLNFKFESNIFVDNKKKFLSKFGIYNKEKISSNLFVQGNFDLENIRTSFYEISGQEKFNTEDINFIESEFNDLMLGNGFEDLFNFQKFKVFLKSARDEKN
tara:strand:- start:836 stop:2467 length:1632 start_codon:yes stop_codon:yes gene_type:complete